MNSTTSSTEEATSSVEIDSATDSMASRTAGTTPNSDSYVSTSESAEPSSKAQVLEELKARIRELEGSPHYKCFICKVSLAQPLFQTGSVFSNETSPCFVFCFFLQEKCKTLIISKICGHYLCEECWITESVGEAHSSSSLILALTPFFDHLFSSATGIVQILPPLQDHHREF